MSRVNRSDISRVMYGSTIVNKIMRGRFQVWPEPLYNEIYVLSGGDYYYVQITEDGDYLLDSSNIVSDPTGISVYYTVSTSQYYYSDSVYREKLIPSDSSDPIAGNVLQATLSQSYEVIEVNGAMYEAYYYYLTIGGVQVKTSEYVLGNMISMVNTYFVTGSAGAIGFEDIRHYWDNGYTASFYFVRTNTYTSDLKGFKYSDSSNNTYSPLELLFYKNGFLLDFHKPANTTSNQTTGSIRSNDNEWRIGWYTLQNTITADTIYRLDINATTHTLSLYSLDGESKGTRSSFEEGSENFLSSYDFYNGLYTNNMFIMQYVAVGRIVFSDASGNVIHDYMLTKDSNASGNSAYSMKDFITNYSTPCTYTNTITEVTTHKFMPGVITETAHFFTGSTNASGFSDIRFRWDNNYTISIYFIKTGDYRNAGLGGFSSLEDGGTQSYSPLEIPTYNNGFFLDFHKPVNTTSNQTTGAVGNNDFEWRVMWQSISSITNNTMYRLDVNATTHTLSLYNASGTLIASQSSFSGGGSNFQSSYNFYSGYYKQGLFTTTAVAFGRIVVRDASGDVVHDYIMTEDSSVNGNGKYKLKDFIEDYSTSCTYTGTITEVATKTFTPGTL